jgi:hypothetical protein
MELLRHVSSQRVHAEVGLWRSTLFRAKTLPLLLGLIAIGACTITPTGPAILALPPAGKDLSQFQGEDDACRGYAEQQIGYGAQQQAAKCKPSGGCHVARTTVKRKRTISATEVCHGMVVRQDRSDRAPRSDRKSLVQRRPVAAGGCHGNARPPR